MFPPVRRSCLALVAVALTCPLPSVRAETRLVDPVPGFRGVIELGRWTPCRVDVEGAAAGERVRLVVHAEDPHGLLVAFPGPMTSVAEDGSAALTASFLVGRIGSRLRLDVENEGGEVLATFEPGGSTVKWLTQSVPLIVTCGSPAGFDPERRSRRRTRERRIVALDGLDELPIDPLLLEAVDTLVVAGDYAIGAERLNAIADWVRDGGHLVFAVGEEREEYRRSGFGTADWIPFRIEANSVDQIRELQRLVTFAGRTDRIPITQRRVEGTVVTGLRGDVLIPADRAPLLVSGLHGLGRVSLLTIDLDRPPLTEWASIDDFAHALVDDGRRPIESRGEGGERLSGAGITDLATQLHSSRERFEPVSRSGRWTVMGLVLVYLVLIGPLDYLLVHFVLGRPHLTWFTFPGVVVLAVLLGTFTAASGNGERLLLNELSVVDVDHTTGTVRGRGFISLYSPHNRRYAIGVVPRSIGSSSSSARVGWSGIPEDAYGGMYRAGGLRFGVSEYRLDAEAGGVENVPVSLWESKSFRFDWTVEGGAADEFGSLRESGSERITGGLRHNLPGNVEDWFLVHAGRMYQPRQRGDRVPPLPPNRLWEVNTDSVEIRDMRRYLTGSFWRTISKGKPNDERNVLAQTDYDVLNRDSFPIVQMISFHRLAGGTGYTGLRNDTFEDLDLSPLLDSGLAVLFGRLDTSVADVTVNGEAITPDRGETYVRIVFPVTPRDAGVAP